MTWPTWAAARTKDANKKFSTTNHAPSSPCLSKCFPETLWGVQGLGDMSHPSPGMALQQTFLCFKLQGFSLALLQFWHMNLCSATKFALHTPPWSLPWENKNSDDKSRNLKIYINLPNAMLHPRWRMYLGLNAEDVVLFLDHVGNNKRQHLLDQFLFSAPCTDYLWLFIRIPWDWNYFASIVQIRKVMHMVYNSRVLAFHHCQHCFLKDSNMVWAPSCSMLGAL